MAWQIEIEDESAGTVTIHDKTYPQQSQGYKEMADLARDRIIEDFVADAALLGGKIKYYNDMDGPKGLVLYLSTTTGQSVRWTMTEV